MVRFNMCLLLVVAVAYVMADESCEGGCPCGQECNGGVCEDGCRVFDVFIPADTTQDVYSRPCNCKADVDEKGRVVECEDGVEYVDAPVIDEWTQNTNCNV